MSTVYLVTARHNSLSVMDDGRCLLAEVETQGGVLQARIVHGQAPLQQTDAASQPVCQVKLAYSC